MEQSGSIESNLFNRTTVFIQEYVNVLEGWPQKRNSISFRYLNTVGSIATKKADELTKEKKSFYSGEGKGYGRMRFKTF